MYSTLTPSRVRSPSESSTPQHGTPGLARTTKYCTAKVSTSATDTTTTPRSSLSSPSAMVSPTQPSNTVAPRSQQRPSIPMVKSRSPSPSPTLELAPVQKSCSSTSTMKRVACHGLKRNLWRLRRCFLKRKRRGILPSSWISTLLGTMTRLFPVGLQRRALSKC